jgi:hydroxypyruvate reductase
MRDTPALHADPRRALLLDLYAAACSAVNGRRAVRAALATAGHAPGQDWSLIAVGKAAASMTLGALDVLGPLVRRGLVISRPGHLDPELAEWPALRCLTGDHPRPGAASLAAGRELQSFAAGCAAGQPVLVLVSGGASSLAEALLPGVGAADLATVSDWALASGAPIGVVNAVRSRLSALKGGRLAAALGHTEARALLISDVPGDDPAVIGSGLAAAGAPRPLPPLPAAIAALLARAPPAPPGAVLPAVVVGSLDAALAAVVRIAEARGLSARRLDPPAAGAVTDEASRFAHELAFTTEDLLVWGGETTVELPAEPGRGGRNQQFALLTASLIAGHGDLVVLAAGTDGSDGNTDDAGAIVDSGTLTRGAASGLEPALALAAANAAPFLQAAGDLLHTGPTGTNVGDIVIGLRRGPEPAADAE